MNNQKLFWLHIRKSGGTSTRNRLPDSVYSKTDHYYAPRCFLQSDPADWNDILNNYRVVLGEYTFRRAQFAKKFLYKDNWDDLLSFAFSREPLDRCLSMFYYVFWRNAEIGARLLDSVRIYRSTGKATLTDSRAFDIFLDVLDECLNDEKKSIVSPNLHFRTHISRMSLDVTDENGAVMLKRIYRLESMNGALKEILGEFGLEALPPEETKRVMNKSKQKRFTPSREQIRKVEALYKDDFDIYENARVV
ncbi:sulfotransferase family 2 domain-containing protein [Hyphococcus sp.]|uniref:sulfotransferase family 2 domain-containing protein n=1 Tax=Hyphococcus sp. TaxID=2038636 RepID=UPI003CCC0083